jgi:hypothetical protein
MFEWHPSAGVQTGPNFLRESVVLESYPVRQSSDLYEVEFKKAGGGEGNIYHTLLGSSRTGEIPSYA